MTDTAESQHRVAHAVPSVLVHLNRAAAVVTGGLATLALLLYVVSRDTDPHGGLYGFVIGGYLLPFSVAFGLAAAGWRRRWRLRVPLQFLPVAVFYLWKLAV